MRDIERFEEAEVDYLLARSLFPNSRRLYIDCMGMTLKRGAKLFEPEELGSPESVFETLDERFGRIRPTIPPLGFTVVGGFRM